MKRSFKWPQIAAFRLARHHLVDRGQPELATICQNVCGLQAQLMAAAEIGFWARGHDLQRAEIHAALYENRTVVKTSCMRQTLHLISASDFSIYINALKRSRLAVLHRIMSRFGITSKEIAALNDAVVTALGAGAMTQPELMQQIKPKAGKKLRTYLELAWSIQAFRPALVEGLICYGPERGGKTAFVRVDRWLPKQKLIEEQEAKQILLRRYLRAYGPATLRDFSRWSGISMQEAKTAWELHQDNLLEISMENEKGFILREDHDQLANSTLEDQVVRLLPHFDSYLLGHADKNHLVDSSRYKQVYRNQGWISPVVLFNGRVIGIWSYTRRGKRWLLEIEPFEKFSRSIRFKIEAEAASLGNFLKTSCEIKIGQGKDHEKT